MRGTSRLLRTELSLYLREPVAVFFALALPLIFLTIFGVGPAARSDPDLDGKNALDVMVPAFTALVAATAGLSSVAIQLTAYRERGVFRRLRATPLTPISLFLAVGGTVFVVTLLGLVLLLVEGTVLGLTAPANPAVFGIGVVLSVAAMLGLGFLVGAALPSVRVAYPVTMAVFMPMIYLSGATIPTEVMSPGVRTIGSWMPLRFAVDLLQGAWDGAPATELVRSAAVLVAVAVASCALAVRFFRWAPAR